MRSSIFCGFLVGGITLYQRVQRGKVAADDFLSGCFAAHTVITDAFARHIYAHICGRFVRALPVDFLEDRIEHREDLHVSVIVDGCLPVCFQMEGIDHINIV